MQPCGHVKFSLARPAPDLSLRVRRFVILRLYIVIATYSFPGTEFALQDVQETQVQSLGWEDSPGGGNGNPLQYFCLVHLDIFLYFSIYESLYLIQNMLVS